MQHLLFPPFDYKSIKGFSENMIIISKNKKCNVNYMKSHYVMNSFKKELVASISYEEKL